MQPLGSAGIARSFERARIETVDRLYIFHACLVSPAHLSGRGLKQKVDGPTFGFRLGIARSFERARIETSIMNFSSPAKCGIARSFERARIETPISLPAHSRSQVSPAHLSGRGLKLRYTPILSRYLKVSPAHLSGRGLKRDMIV